MINKVTSLSRVNKQIIMLFIDSVVLISILFASFSIRLGYWYFPQNELIWAIFGAPVIAIPVFIRFGLYRAVIRYIGFKALWAVVQAVSLYALVWGVVGFMMAVDGIPRSVILINWLLSLLAIGGLRIIARILFSGNFTLEFLGNSQNDNQKKVLVYGAGDAGVQLVVALEYSSEYAPVGFIDDSVEIQGHHIRGLNVCSIDNVGKVISELKVDEVLIAMPSASRAKRLSLINTLEPYSVLVRLLPSVADLAKGKVKIDDLHEVSVHDLLGRGKVEPKQSLLEANIKNKVVMVTGAGGSVGSELCRQVINLGASELILFEQNELALYIVDKELSSNGNVFPVLGSVINQDRIERVCKQFGVNTIYHAAAYKHVPMVEYNNSEGIVNNIFGTLRCAKAAINCNVETFVLISTDKAVRPTNTMGATKRSAEIVLQALSECQSITKFIMVRFGNVLNSSGSVVPLFKEQIKAGGPITVTHKEIVRYFMTAYESVELVIQAGAMGVGGEVFVLDMGKPVKIFDLAVKIIHLTGLKVKDKLNPDGDIEIKITGLRPGEKLFEELLISDNVLKTKHPMIMKAREEMISWDDLSVFLNALEVAVTNYNQDELRSLLMQIVPEFKPQCAISDLLYKKY
jgi:FlaA1/EpsC-like NDP-sugar epimerase